MFGKLNFNKTRLSFQIDGNVSPSNDRNSDCDEDHEFDCGVNDEGLADKSSFEFDAFCAFCYQVKLQVNETTSSDIFNHLLLV